MPRVEGESLADLVERRRRELGAFGKRKPYRDMADYARANGGKISHGLIQRIGSGGHRGVLRDEEARGLALALEVPERVVYAAMRVPTPPGPFAEELPRNVDRLTRRQRDGVLSVISAMLEPGEVAATPVAPLRRVARRPGTPKQRDVDDT